MAEGTNDPTIAASAQRTMTPVQNDGKVDDNWAHRHTGMRCSSCMWYVEKEGVSLKPKGRCRRRAPTMSGYPVVFYDDWCGDHKMR